MRLVHSHRPRGPRPAVDGAQGRSSDVGGQGQDVGGQSLTMVVRKARLGPDVGSGRAGRVTRVHQDRKSTRLNSSHVAISYAVFCLKKKTNQTSIRITMTKEQRSREQT